MTFLKLRRAAGDDSEQNALKVMALNRCGEDYLSRLFLRLFAWYLIVKSRQRDAYAAWDSALWTRSFFKNAP